MAQQKAPTVVPPGHRAPVPSAAPTEDCLPLPSANGAPPGDVLLERGRYRARRARTPEDLAACQALRSAVFRNGAPDADPFDARCIHVMVTDRRDDRMLCCFRLMLLASGAEITRSYAAQHYGLDALAAFEGPMAELGRFCMDPATQDPDVLRIAWAAVTALVDAAGVMFLFGCSSFQGTQARLYEAAFALLHARHLAPERWQPSPKAPEVVHFTALSRTAPPRPDLRAAQAALPPLLRSYLAMGGWVSDHAVVDRDLGTLHVFTGLEVAAIPPARKRLLRALAGQGAGGK